MGKNLVKESQANKYGISNSYTKESYIEKVQKLKEEINGNAESSIQVLINSKYQELQKQIENVEAKEKIMFSLLNINMGSSENNLKELNRRLKDYDQAALSLSGPEMERMFLFQIENESKTSAQTFDDAVREVIKDILDNNKNGQGKQVWYKYASNLALKELNEIGKRTNKTSNSKIGFFTSVKGWKDSSGLDDVQASLFTKEQQKAFIRLIKEKYANRKEEFPYIKKFLIEEENSVSTGEQTFKKKIVFNWLEVTGRKTQNEFKEELKDDSKSNEAKLKLEKINYRISNELISQVSPRYYRNIRAVISHVLEQHSTEFLQGKNPKGIEGVLGEIQALFYISILTGRYDFGVNTSSPIYWQGGVIESKAKPHRDIVLNNLGIQVKNTKEDILKQGHMGVSFWEKKMSTFLNDLGLNEDIKKIFYQAFTLKAFNVPYMKEEGQYIKSRESTSPDFNEAYLDFQQNVMPQIDKLLSLFSAAIMYIDASDDISNISQQDLNVLFILGGVAAYTASQVLKDALSNFEKQSNNTVSYNETSSNLTTVASTSYNIVAALNDKQRGKNFTETVLDSIFLRSSYNFQF